MVAISGWDMRSYPYYADAVPMAAKETKRTGQALAGDLRQGGETDQQKSRSTRAMAKSSGIVRKKTRVGRWSSLQDSKARLQEHDRGGCGMVEEGFSPEVGGCALVGKREGGDSKGLGSGQPSAARRELARSSSSRSRG